MYYCLSYIQTVMAFTDPEVSETFSFWIATESSLSFVKVYHKRVVEDHWSLGNKESSRG